eukprot:393525-Prymnesium_polylepis.1
MRPKLYDDFVECPPTKERARKAPFAPRVYIPLKCPHCTVVFTKVPAERILVQKAYVCKQHLVVCPGSSTNESCVSLKRPRPVDEASATHETPTCCRAAVELDAMRQQSVEEARLAADRHTQLMNELQTTRVLRDAIALGVAKELEISPNDALTVANRMGSAFAKKSTTLSETLGAKDREIKTLRASGAAKASEIASLKRQLLAQQSRVHDEDEVRKWSSAFANSAVLAKAAKTMLATGL